MTPKELKDAHRHSSYHRDEVLASNYSGCFYCISTFSPDMIKEWIDNDQTVLCPFCGIDSVIPGSTDLLVPGFLVEMNGYWFGPTEWSPIRH